MNKTIEDYADEFMCLLYEGMDSRKAFIQEAQALLKSYEVLINN